MDAGFFLQAFEHAHEAFAAVGSDGDIAAWNPAAESLYGYTAAEAVGRPLDLLCFPEERLDLAAVARAQSGGSDGRPELIRRQRHKSGRELWVSLRIVRLDLPARQPRLLLCAVDVSRRQQAEKALAASRSELRRVAGSLVAAGEEARRQIARELHDDVGQRLAALALELRVVRKQFAHGDSRSTELATVGGSLAELAEDLHRLSHDLHPAALERRGLAEALRDRCGEVERRSGLPVRLSLRDAEGPFPPDIALGLYRIVQEALTNAARHAGARTAHLTLTVAAGTAHLVVADDGAGFDPDAARRGRGLGLASIEERARLLGGECRIASALGAGTEIEVRVPMQTAPEPPAAGAAGP